MRENIHGQVFDMQTFYPQLRGKNILDLSNAGLSHREISADVQVSLSLVNKLLKYDQNNFSMPQEAFSGEHESAVYKDVQAYLTNEKLK